MQWDTPPTHTTHTQEQLCVLSHSARSASRVSGRASLSARGDQELSICHGGHSGHLPQWAASAAILHMERKSGGEPAREKWKLLCAPGGHMLPQEGLALTRLDVGKTAVSAAKPCCTRGVEDRI